MSMQKRSVTFFGVIALAAAWFGYPASAADWGDLKLTFVYDGKAPAPSPVEVTKDQEFCGKHNLVDESLVVNAANGGVANVAVYLYLERGAAAPPIHESYAKTENDEVVIDNDKCRYAPHVVTLRTTQTLVIGNKDPVGHNSKVDSFANAPVNYTIPSGQQLKLKMTEPERLPTRVGCAIHPWMSAWLVVRDNPYFAVSDKDGKVEIKNLPAGKWTFQVWQEKAGYVQRVNVGGAPAEWARGRVEVEIKPGANDLGVVKLSSEIFMK